MNVANVTYLINDNTVSDFTPLLKTPLRPDEVIPVISLESYSGDSTYKVPLAFHLDFHKFPEYDLHIDQVLPISDGVVSFTYDPNKEFNNITVYIHPPVGKVIRVHKYDHIANIGFYKVSDVCRECELAIDENCCCDLYNRII